MRYAYTWHAQCTLHTHSIDTHAPQCDLLKILCSVHFLVISHPYFLLISHTQPLRPRPAHSTARIWALCYFVKASHAMPFHILVAFGFLLPCFDLYFSFYFYLLCLSSFTVVRCVVDAQCSYHGDCYSYFSQILLYTLILFVVSLDASNAAQSYPQTHTWIASLYGICAIYMRCTYLLILCMSNVQDGSNDRSLILNLPLSLSLSLPRDPRQLANFS